MLGERTPVNDRIDTARRTRALALIALSLGVFTACGGDPGERAASSAAPTPPPVVDDSTFSVVPPSEPPPVGALPDGSTSTTGPRTGGAAPDAGASAQEADPAPAPPGAVTGASSTTARTTPGIADGATALPPSATVDGSGRCSLTALRLEPLDLQGSPGGTYANFRLRNVSSGACAVRGHVGATLIGDGGNAMPTTVRREDGPEQWVRIARGGSAQFHLRFPNPYSGDSPCNPPNAARVRVTLPGSNGSLTAASPEGGIQACRGELSTAPIGST